VGCSGSCSASRSSCCAWSCTLRLVLFPLGIIPVEHAFLAQLYVSSAITTFALSAAIAYYAFRLAERAEAETRHCCGTSCPTRSSTMARPPGRADRDAFADASILFSDIKALCRCRTASALRARCALNELMRRFDALALKYGVEKIKDDRDAYMAVPIAEPGCRSRPSGGAKMALDMFARERAVARIFGVVFRMRIGIASGRSWPG